MRTLFALLCGLLFGIGLTVADMTDPAKVQNFLDIAGAWDPSLIFVMAGATLVAVGGFWLAQKRQKPLFAAQFHLPPARRIDARLIGGSALFGVGWGLSGFCPGPVIAGLAWGNPRTFLFAAAMVAGMALAGRFTQEEPESATAAAAE
jgi:uncharacterized membrane protein YedE/YeeE